MMRIPTAAAATRVGFAELARRHGDYAMVGLAACARSNGAGLTGLRLVYFGVAPVPARARNAEIALQRGDLDGAMGALATDLDPSDDVQATASVKRHLARVLLGRVAGQLMQAPRLEALQ
jgi:carbon-monoxide dehydrogenase medium subunit